MIDIIVRKKNADLYEEEFQKYDNYLVLNKTLQEQLKKAVKEKLK
jgi:hypothetical protein